MIKNKAQVLQRLDLFVERYERLTVAAFRKAVWEVFCRILEQTPQYTGQGVASWNLGIDAPDNTYDPGVGDDQVLTKSGYVSRAGIRARGDNYWIEYAKIKNKQRLFLIKRDSRVFITNAARGDTDNGRSSEMYMESLQDPGYWAVKLRNANKPYETAAETLLLFQIGKLDLGELGPFV